MMRQRQRHLEAVKLVTGLPTVLRVAMPSDWTVANEKHCYI